MIPLVFLFGLALVPPPAANATATVTRNLQVERTAPKIVSDRPMVLDRRSDNPKAPQKR